MAISRLGSAGALAADNGWVPSNGFIEIGDLVERLVKTGSRLVEVVYKRGRSEEGQQVKESFTGENALSPGDAIDYLMGLINPPMKSDPRSSSYCLAVPIEGGKGGFSVKYGLNFGDFYDRVMQSPFIHIDLVFQH